MKKKSKKQKILQKDNCTNCGGRCIHSTDIHPSMLKCEKCGQLNVNPNYDYSFIGG
ncbi:MAG: hypothetical protein WCI93_02915 [bacterium]